MGAVLEGVVHLVWAKWPSGRHISAIQMGAYILSPDEIGSAHTSYVAGAITRIKCRGFMTYDNVDFCPGPHLNMILGPNGTGKSSLAAAIAIGLGFSPEVMGRAKDVVSYIKQGTDIAETEIELKGKPGKPNIVIKRRMTREDGKSEWHINNVQSTHRAVTENVVSMGIQANNLCSFLPQDKVAEFAKMAPVTVLRETMRAAGDPRLTSWHEQLREKGAKCNAFEESLDKDIAERNRLQEIVDRMEPEVRHYQAREEQEKEVSRALGLWESERPLTLARNPRLPRAGRSS